MRDFWFSGKMGLVTALLLSSLSYGHVAEGAGEALQLYSYRLTGDAPVIDGSAFSRNGDPSTKDALDEWKEAYVRKIKLSDNSEASLLLCNSDDTLYVAVNYDHGNNGAGSGVYLYFDEGDNGSDDGEHDHILGAANGDRNEAGYAVFKGGTAETSWDGSAWSADGDGATLQDFNGARYFFNDAVKVHSHEFAIPLKTTSGDDVDNSDLQMTLTDEVGFFLQVVKTASGGGTFSWDATAGDVTDPNGWADIRLNVDNKFFAFYGTYAANGSPTIDGVLNDDAWRGSYRREIILTNFEGETMKATLHATQNHTNGIVYFGVEVEDGVENSDDYLQIYIEDSPGAGSDARDYALDDLMEDALRINGNSSTDYHWNSATPAWTDDNGLEAADSHDGKSTYADGKHLFEGAIPYEAAAYDVDLSAGAQGGIILRYHDADASAGEEEFYWDYGANAPGIKIDPNSNDFLAIGWPVLQLGAPYVQVIYPEDQKSVEGIVNFRVAAIDENDDGIDSAYFYRIQTPDTKTNLTRVADSDEYSGTWDVTSIPDGPDTLVVVVVDDEGIKIDRLVIVTISNDGGVTNEPQVVVVSPKPGEALKSTYEVLFRVLPDTLIDTREISIDGSLWDTTGVGDSTYSLVTDGMENGSHDVTIRIKDSDGRIVISQSRTFFVDNEAPLTADPKVIYSGTNMTANQNSTILITTLVKDNIVGLAVDSAVVLRSDAISSTELTSLVMSDDGTGGDFVAGDNIYTGTLSVATDSSGLIDFTVTTTDKLGNSTSVTGSVVLDNISPVIDSFDYHPDLESATANSGTAYDEHIIIRGSYSDSGGSGIHQAVITLTNEEGDYVNNSPIELNVEDTLFSRIIQFVPGVNVLTFTVFDKAGNSTERIDTITFIEPKVTKVIGSSGGIIESQNGVSVSIPANALRGDEEITITRVSSEELPEPEKEGIILMGVAHEFGPDGQAFRVPVTVTLTYTEADLDRDLDGEPDLDPSELGVVFWDGESWNFAGSASVDTVNRRVSVSVNHFTIFDIAELSIETPTELVTYWSNNPLSAEEGSLFNYRIPGKGTVSLSILDMSGDLVYQLIRENTSVETGYYSAVWYGQNSAEREAAPGIYVAVFSYTPISGSRQVIRKPIGLLR